MMLLAPSIKSDSSVFLVSYEISNFQPTFHETLYSTTSQESSRRKTIKLYTKLLTSYSPPILLQCNECITFSTDTQRR